MNDRWDKVFTTAAIFALVSLGVLCWVWIVLAVAQAIGG